MRTLFGSILSLCICTFAESAPVCSTPAHHAQAILAPPVSVVVPLYAAQYAPQPTQPVSDDVLREILAELRALREAVEANRPPGALPLRAADIGPILAAKCGACHGAKVAETKGAGMVLTDEKGAAWKLSGPEKRAVKEQVSSGKMPRGGTLTANEKAAILAAVK